jgi:hypothetical protein
MIWKHYLGRLYGKNVHTLTTEELLQAKTALVGVMKLTPSDETAQDLIKRIGAVNA